MDSKAIGSSQLSSLLAASGPKTQGTHAQKPDLDSMHASSGRKPDVRLESLATARDMAAAGPPVDQAKIADVQQRIREGRFAPDPAQIAEAMIRMDLL